MKPTMTDINENVLTGEGIPLQAIFGKDGKVTLYMEKETHSGNARIRCGEIPSPNVPVLYRLLMPEEIFKFLVLPPPGIWIRMRLRYPESDVRNMELPGHGPEACFPVWVAREKDGRTGLFLQDLTAGTCAVPDITGLPGLPSDGVPAKAEMLIRRDGPFPEDCTCRRKDGGSGTGLMQEGISVWISFKAEGKAALYAQERIRLAHEGYVPGRLLSSDISPLHEVYDWDSQYPWIRSKSGRWVRYRIRLRYPGTDDTGAEQSEYEPEACFPAWLVLKDGRTGLYLHEPAEGGCLIPDMEGLPGLPGLKPDDAPVRVELLIRQSHWIFDLADPALLKTGSCSGRLKPCLQGHPTLKK